MNEGSSSHDSGRSPVGRYGRIFIPLITVICAGMVMVFLYPVPAIIPAGATVVLMGMICFAWVRYRA